MFTEDGRLLGIVSESITRTHKSPVTSLQQRKKVAAGELFHSMAKGVLTRVIPAAVIEHLIQVIN